MQKSMLADALSYLARGWSVIPLCPHDHEGVPNAHKNQCKSPGKAPLWPWKEYQEKLAKESAITFFWKRTPTCNVGIVMGPVSGLLGLDIDGHAGHELFMSLAAGEVPETLEFTTPGGGHRFLFKWPGFDVKIKRFKDDVGHEAIRILAKGSQTVAPPSIHEKGGTYTWCDGHAPGQIEPAECPPWLISLLQAGNGQKTEELTPAPTATPAAVEKTESVTLTVPQGPNEKRIRAYIDKCPPAISGAGGHDQTLKVATGLVRGFALDPETAYSWMEYYNAKCQPHWTPKELIHKVSEAAKSTMELGYLMKDDQKLATKSKNAKSLSVQAVAEPVAVTRKFKDVKQKAIEWLWPKWIPLGKLAILDGDPGLGKSTMLIDLAARISVAGIMPDNSIGVSGNVILMSAEDAPEDTIRPRLDAAEANIDRVHDLSVITKNGEDRPPEIPADLPFIEKKIAELQARLLVIDPLMAFLYGADANKDQEIRRVLFRLSRIAEKHRCAIICMRHLNKGGSGKAIYRGNSSIGVIGHARTGLIVAADPDDPDHKRVLAVSKCNLAAKPKSLQFTLDPIGDVCRIGWSGNSHYNADDLVAQPPTGEEKEAKEDNQNKVEQTKAILEMLMEQYEGQLEIKMAKAECFAANMTQKSLMKAIKVLAWDVKYKTDELGKRTYYWTKPGDAGEGFDEPNVLPYSQPG